MYKIIKTHPTKEQISAFKMKVNVEDDYVDYVVKLDSLSEEEKSKFCLLYDMNINDMKGKEKIQLSIASSI